MPTVSERSYRWAIITPHDRSGLLYVVAFLAFTYSCITFLTRIYIKWHKSGIEDVAMLLAQVTSMIQFALLLSSLSAGLGKSYDAVSPSQYLHIASTQYGGQIAIYLSLGFSKLATALLVRRLFPPDMIVARTVCNTITIALILWTLFSALSVSAGCSAESASPRTPVQICSGTETRYLAVIITDVVSDFGLAIIPAILCRNLQMSFTKKIQVLGIFGLRLPLIPLAILFFTAWKRWLYSENPGITCSTPLIYQQIELCYSLIAGTIPCLKSFIQSFDTGSGLKVPFEDSAQSRRPGQLVGSQDVTTNQSESYEMTGNTPEDGVRSVREDLGAIDAVRVNKNRHIQDNIVTSVGEGVIYERRSTQESDRKSQHSAQPLLIQKDVQWKVSHEKI